MALHSILRSISHTVSERVTVLLTSVGFLRKAIPPTPENKEALKDLTEAAADLREQAHKLEAATRSKLVG